MFEQTNPQFAGGYQYYNGMPVQQAQKFNNVLTSDEIKSLQQKDAQFSLGLTQEEVLRGVCNHRNPEGDGDALVYDPVTGEARCTICGYTFRPVDASLKPEDIKESVANVIDVLQTIKLMYIDLPAQAAKDYFPIIPLLEKIPQLFEYAAKNMTKHDAYNWQYSNRNMGTMAMFQNLNAMFGAMNGMQYQQPQFQQQPMMGQPAGFPNAAYGQPNPFGYQGASMYQPGTNPAFAYTPSQQATPVAPTVAAPTAPTAPAAADATVTQSVNI